MRAILRLDRRQRHPSTNRRRAAAVVFFLKLLDLPRRAKETSSSQPASRRELAIKLSEPVEQ
jgi:hypothetical protein